MSDEILKYDSRGKIVFVKKYVVEKLQKASDIRDRIHNLDIDNNQEDKKCYALRRYQLCALNEGEDSDMYQDNAKKQNPTIAIGFNMKRLEAQAEWENAFAGLKSPPSFKKAYKKEIALTEEQMRMLFEHSVKIREKEVKHYYKGVWHRLRANERLAIEDAYYNHPGLVKTGTMFHKHITNYANTSDIKHLTAAALELRDKSNKDHANGIQNRRYVQVEMLSSDKCQFYTTPDMPPLAPPIRIMATLGKTIIPRNIDHWPKGQDTGYYIWRTANDGKVRKSHQDIEGMIFSEKVGPNFRKAQDTYNCRCTSEPLPLNVVVVEEKSAVTLQRAEPARCSIWSSGYVGI